MARTKRSSEQIGVDRDGRPERIREEVADTVGDLVNLGKYDFSVFRRRAAPISAVPMPSIEFCAADRIFSALAVAAFQSEIGCLDL
jgi:hypothetical protein